MEGETVMQVVISSCGCGDCGNGRCVFDGDAWVM